MSEIKININDERLDRLFTSKMTGIPIMLLMFFAVFWLTIVGANYPSQLLSEGFTWLEGILLQTAVDWNLPKGLCEFFILGIYRVSTWVIAVVLPPMLIFFPLFSLLEEFGYLPRVAFNMDRCLRRCNACGKQALTTCMGFGCNAVGVIGSQMIESPREKLLAILTNSFVPCNGRFPLLIAVITMFVACNSGIAAAVALTGLIALSVCMSFMATFVLSKTLLRGESVAVILELPPYKCPNIKDVIVWSICDRMVFVLKRSIVVAAPAGGVIWLVSNINWHGESIIVWLADFLEPMGQLMGLDGVILLAFILGMPANELVLPLMFMIYMQTNRLSEIGDMTQIRTLFVDNGWTMLTAVNVMLFSMFHWPCATTLLTIKHETDSLKWTGLALLIPTVCGILICIALNAIATLLMIA